MPFGHGIENPEDYYPNEKWLKEPNMSLDNFVQSGPGYVLSENVVTGKISAEVDNASKSEPAVNTGVLMGAIPVIAVVVRYLWPNLLSDNNWDVTFYLIALFIPVVTAFFIRGKVWSPASVSQVLKDAIQAAENSRKK